MVAERYAEAILAAADRLRLVLGACEAPEAAAYSYDDPDSFLAGFAPGDACRSSG